LGWLIWALADVLLLGFAAVLFAIILRSIAGPIERHTPIRAPWSLVVAGLLVTAAAGSFFYLLGAQVYSQASSVAEKFPDVLSSFGERLGVDDLPKRIFEQAEAFAGRSTFAERIVGYTSGVLSALASFVLVIMAGVYFAARPQQYRNGALKLLPKGVQADAGSALENVGNALRLWLLGQIISMTMVGTVTTIGLYVIGVPSALALGVLAGLSEFVPLVGPIVSAVPAVLIALAEGGTMVYWVIGLYIVVQQIESNLIMPLVQRKVVDLPPALTLFSILGFGVLFGPLGLLLGTPLAVAAYVLVKQLYIRDALHQATQVPGEAR
jgi:predicted PurR-regulated permease PerM